MPKNSIQSLMLDLSKKNTELHSQLIQYMWKNSGFYKNFFPKICFSEKELSSKECVEYLKDNEVCLEDKYIFYWHMVHEVIKENGNLNFDDLSKSYDILFNLFDKIDFSKFNKKIKNKKEKIIIFANQYLDDTIHSPSNTVKYWVNEFSELGYRVIIISTPVKSYPYPLKVSYELNSISDGSLVEIKISDNIYFYELLDSPVSDNFSKLIDLLEPSNKDYYLLVGHSSLFFDLMPGENKTIIPVSEKTAGLTVSANSIVYPGKISIKNIYNKQMRFIKGPDHYPLINNKKIQYKNDFISMGSSYINLVTIGNRLVDEIKNDFWSMLSSLFTIVPNAKLHIVGSFPVSSVPDVLKEFVVLHGFLMPLELSNLLDEMNFYINPDREGGGTSARMAILRGIPVVTLPKGDVYESLKRLYYVESYSDYPDFILSYLSDSSVKNAVDSANKSLINLYDNWFLDIRNAAKEILNKN